MSFIGNAASVDCLWVGMGSSSCSTSCIAGCCTGGVFVIICVNGRLRGLNAGRMGRRLDIGYIEVGSERQWRSWNSSINNSDEIQLLQLLFTALHSSL